MQLKQTCKVCDSKHARKIAELEKAILDESLRNVAIGALPKPKPITIESESSLGSNVLVKYSCGHVITMPRIEYENISKNSSRIVSNVRNFEPFGYQYEGIKFIVDTGFNALIADEMGLGKTAQILAAIRQILAAAAENQSFEVSPTVIIVKSATLYQWIREYGEWTSLDPMGICPIVTSKDLVIPGFQAYILSMDLLPSVKDKLVALKPKLIIADEVQSFKNPNSARAKALVKLVQESGCQHKVFLSGTPVMNRASEYFVVLNLLAPGYFPSFKNFCMRWLEPNAKGVPTRIRKRLIPEFRNLTSRWILRRECKDVQKDLPPLRRSKVLVNIESDEFKAMYNAEKDLFSNWLNDPSVKHDQISLLGWLARLRHTTEVAKVQYCTEWVKEWLESTEGDSSNGESAEPKQKIAIGIHHKEVRDALHYNLEPYGCVKLSGEDSAEKKSLLVKKFQEPDTRVLVINEVSGGTGLDGLQVCNNVIILARQWNAALEEQFEKRFNRTGQTQPVNAIYMMAENTIDSQFEQWVEEKREIARKTYGNDWSADLENDYSSLYEFSQLVASSGRLR